MLAGMAGTALARAAGAEPNPPALGQATASSHPDYVVRDLTVAGDASVGRRFTLLVPKHLKPGQRVPLLVLLHGLGETHDQRVGAYAWLERYGLGSSHARLRHAPIQKQAKRGDWTDERLSDVNTHLAARPFRGMVIACPFTPNVGKLRMGRGAALEAYTQWLTDVVIPRARAEAPVESGAKHTYLDGCSLGGYVGLEVFLRRPDFFGAWGGVQSAFGVHRVTSYAERLEQALGKVGPRPLHLLTSTADPFRKAQEALSQALTQRGIPNDLRVSPGPHDQPWLRETGTIEMLLWHDRPKFALGGISGS